MSEVKLNIIDGQAAIHGTIHGSVAERLVAALSAEPETIEELEAALSRFEKPLADFRPFMFFQNGVCDEAWDAGIMFIDLAARVVVAETTYFVPLASGEVTYHDGTKATEIPVLYRVPDDWIFPDSIAEYEGVREARRRARMGKAPLDAREILYGPALLEFIVTQCIAVRPTAADPIAEIHARWLMMPRADLRGRSPREVLLEKLDFINFDLHTRELQWSIMGEGPPCLARSSYAYRYAGFGTHEYVLYYELVRCLLAHCLKRVIVQGNLKPEDEVERLQRVRDDWLEKPQDDCTGMCPANIIECERKRMPLAMSPKAAMIDDDCPICQMLGHEMGPVFQHLDGCNMDDDFPFSFHLTRDDWEEERRRQEEFSREFDRCWEERKEEAPDEETCEAKAVQQS
jgi:hypothetical protein